MVGSNENANKFWENVWRNCQVVRDGRPVKLITVDMVESCGRAGGITHKDLEQVAMYLYGDKNKIPMGSMEVDYKLLKKSLRFPLWVDEEGDYLWDQDNTMVAQFEDKYKELFSRLSGDIKEPKKGWWSITAVDGEFFLNEEYIGCVRGWGTFQYRKKDGARVYDPEYGAKVQDNVVAYILSVLNYGD